jgi:hypothetical protein
MTDAIVMNLHTSMILSAGRDSGFHILLVAQSHDTHSQRLGDLCFNTIDVLSTKGARRPRTTLAGISGQTSKPASPNEFSGILKSCLAVSSHGVVESPLFINIMGSFPNANLGRSLWSSRNFAIFSITSRRKIDGY